MSRQQILERERRWALPAALCAFGAVAISIISLPIEQSALQGTGTGEQLLSINEHASSFLLANVIRGIGLMLLVGPFLYLFEAARARSSAVRGALVGLVVLGPILFAAQSIASGVVTMNIADDYAALPDGGPPQQLPKDFTAELKDKPESFEQITFYTDDDAMDVERSTDTPICGSPALAGRPCVITYKYPQSSETDLQDAVDAQGVSTSEDTDGKPGDDAAQKLIDDSNSRQTVASLLFPALLALIVGIFYPCLQAMRVGLLTRFFGTLGMAIGVSVVFVGLLGLLLYTLALGFLIIGRFPGGRPPAWDAGEAIPWPQPGQAPAPAPADPDAIEGDATEVDENSNAARRERAKKRKRKRRR